MNDRKLTIGIPVYERYEYFEEALMSAVIQIVPVEIIVIDNGSSHSKFEEYVKSLNFHSPYGCSKGAADQYLLDFARIYGIKTVVFRHSSMYGGNQHSTIDQGWIGWFCQKALDIKNNKAKDKFTISGSGKQVRDVLYAEDVVSLYFSASKNIDKVQGKAFNIGGGIENSLSLLELFKVLENELNIKMEFNRLPERESDQLVFVANNEKICNLLLGSHKSKQS